MDINEYLEELLADFEARCAAGGGRTVYPAVIYEVTEREPGFMADNGVMSEVFEVRVTVYAHTAKQSWSVAEEVCDVMEADGWIAESMHSAGFDGAFMTELTASCELFNR